MDCLFCKIINKEIEASIVYEDDKCIVVLDIQPVNEGHTMVIPKGHYVTLADCPDEIARHLMSVLKKFNVAVSKTVKCGGIFNAIMNGEEAQQEVFHLHLHIVPRSKGDGFDFIFPEKYGKVFPTRSELNNLAEKIKENSN